MTSDELRRAVAARLRGLRGFEVEGKKFCSCYDVEDALGLEGSIMCSRTAVETLADLIDRPTCHDTGERVNSFTCSSCGFYEEKIVFNPFTYSFRGLKPDWNYCPNCGAEVVNDD